MARGAGTHRSLGAATLGGLHRRQQATGGCPLCVQAICKERCFTAECDKNYNKLGLRGGK
jgi:hypothetical protein